MFYINSLNGTISFSSDMHHMVASSSVLHQCSIELIFLWWTARSGLEEGNCIIFILWICFSFSLGKGVDSLTNMSVSIPNREVAQIDQFLQETAAREANAKVRLQQFIEELLDRADRAEKQLQIISSCGTTPNGSLGRCSIQGSKGNERQVSRQVAWWWGCYVWLVVCKLDSYVVTHCYFLTFPSYSLGKDRSFGIIYGFHF